ncbi:hypothetical protein ACHAXR_005280 [Thalassiosira sp. AJA248-18]
MIITGSARSIVVKLAYQSGFRAPLTVTLLYLFGRSLSLFVYLIQKWLANDYRVLSMPKDDGVSELNHDESPSLELCERAGGGEDVDVGEQRQDDANSPPMNQTDDSTVTTQSEPSASIPLATSSDLESRSSAIFEFYTTALASLYYYEDDIPNGSNHGLSSESEERIKWVHGVPFYAKPAIPAVLNLLASALRWASLVYIDASVAEMMISGLELTLSVIAARIFRKRMVAKSRWVGVSIVALGIIIIERANNSKEEDDSDEGTRGAQDVMIGVVLIILQSVLSALQDLGEEVFMQAADYPATLLLGIEGLYGFCIGLIIYSTIGDKLMIEDIDSTISMLSNNAKLRWWLFGLPFLFLIAGLFNIKSTEVTSAMTRNVWKTLRTVLVWTIALGIFYLGKDSDYGEAWHTPESFIIFLGFLVMSSGLLVYYCY